MLRVNEILNERYLIAKKISEGSFGNVFLAKDLHLPSNKPCVVKELKGEFKSPDMLSNAQIRFNQEAVVLEQIGEKFCGRVPRLQAYFNVGNFFYIVQDFIYSETYKTKWSESEVKIFLKEILKTLSLLHQQNIIHRDIKPSNILIRKDDLFPVLIDFGLIKLIPQGNLLINPSLNVGTNLFSPIEQIGGFPVPASDLYALGVTVICWLSGQNSPRSFVRLNNDNNVIFWDHSSIEISKSFKSFIKKATEIFLEDRYLTSEEMLSDLLKIF